MAGAGSVGAGKIADDCGEGKGVNGVNVWARLLAGLADPSGAAIATLIGAVIGGIIAGLTTWLVQRMAIKEAKAERLSAKRQADLAVALTTITKVIKMFSAIRNIRNAFEGSVAMLKEPGFDPHRPWEALQPFATLPSEVIFDPGEAAFLLGTNVKAIMLTSLELADVYNDLLEMLRVYSRHRYDIMRELPATVVDGRVVSVPMSLETALRLSPTIVPLNVLFTALMGRIDKDYSQAEMVFVHLRAHCVQRFGRDFPPMEFIDSSPPGDPSVI